MKTNARKSILEKFIKKAALDKRAEDAVNDVNSADLNNPEEYANAIFDKLLSTLEIEGLEDLEDLNPKP